VDEEVVTQTCDHLYYVTNYIMRESEMRRRMRANFELPVIWCDVVTRRLVFEVLIAQSLHHHLMCHLLMPITHPPFRRLASQASIHIWLIHYLFVHVVNQPQRKLEA